MKRVLGVVSIVVGLAACSSPEGSPGPRGESSQPPAGEAPAEAATAPTSGPTPPGAAKAKPLAPLGSIRQDIAPTPFPIGSYPGSVFMQGITPSKRAEGDYFTPSGAIASMGFDVAIVVAAAPSVPTLKIDAGICNCGLVGAMDCDVPLVANGSLWAVKPGSMCTATCTYPDGRGVTATATFHDSMIRVDAAGSIDGMGTLTCVDTVNRPSELMFAIAAKKN